MAGKRDYYEVLGVPRDADDNTIRKAFRKLAMEHHPDRHGGSEEAAARFKEINEAQQHLSDPQKRAWYDRLGHAPEHDAAAAYREAQAQAEAARRQAAEQARRQAAEQARRDAGSRTAGAGAEDAARSGTHTGHGGRSGGGGNGGGNGGHAWGPFKEKPKPVAEATKELKFGKVAAVVAGVALAGGVAYMLIEEHERTQASKQKAAAARANWQERATSITDTGARHI